MKAVCYSRQICYLRQICNSSSLAHSTQCPPPNQMTLPMPEALPVLHNIIITPTWSEIGYPMNWECFLTTSLILFSSRYSVWSSFMWRMM